MSNEIVLSKIRDYLKINAVKLWIPPYTTSEGEQGEEIQSLAAGIAPDLKISPERALETLEELRVRSIKRLKQNEKFKNQQIATLKIRLSTNQKSDAKEQYKTLETNLEICGHELEAKIIEQLNLNSPSSQFKLIHSGKIIKSDALLTSQNIKHNAVIMCVVASQLERDNIAETETQMGEVERAKRGAELLATKSKFARSMQVDIADQDGRSLDLPEEERESLTVALGLHEKGRDMLKRKQYATAILILLEADSHFQNCRAEILKAVDNYAVLCLDIVWCYVMLRDITALPDAHLKLSTCEESLKNSYGDSLTRLLAIKGSSGNEVALFVRLYLMQAIVEYHKGNFEIAKEKLNKAEGFAGIIKVDVEKVEEVMLLGFTATQARSALRACNNDVGRATQHAFQQKEEREKIKQEEKAKRRNQSLINKFGRCQNGSEINSKSLEYLKSMGYEPIIAAEALKQSDNNVERAIDAIQNNYDKIAASAAMLNTSTEFDESVKQLTDMGFNADDVRACLLQFSGEIQQVVTYLSENKVARDDWLAKIPTALLNLPSTSSNTSKPKITDEEQVLMNEAAKSLDHDEKEYLDITLDEEQELIQLYKGYLSSLNSQQDF